jgi:hypothetical protein
MFLTRVLCFCRRVVILVTVDKEKECVARWDRMIIKSEQKMKGKLVVEIVYLTTAMIVKTTTTERSLLGVPTS